MKWPNLDLSAEDAVLWTMVGGVVVLVIGLTGIQWRPQRVYVPEHAKVLIAIGAGCVTWALFKKNKPG